ncbi:2OG-Fe(II) oxygenase family protein [Reticulomyxa filosa]|uniref:2OG-Fe(II) oxygenase family protein n=1 Tax=Reticulomyxa filosa TaxID=46433 RepID=X6LVU0_RETFI|nr:2OG-Fe(II) oxygenase family protein [Reticulomyxa filosa]|eukprot:ETO05471.1 2OG-Fe(II) oxygenase family protein [Reticulomyxa filosa]
MKKKTQVLPKASSSFLKKYPWSSFPENVQMSQTKQEELAFELLPPELKLKILEKLNLVDGVLSGTVEAPPLMDFSMPTKIGKSSQQKKKKEQTIDNEENNSKEERVETHSTIITTMHPKTTEPSPLLFDNIVLNALQENKSTTDSNLCFSLQNAVNLQKHGYVVIDDFIDGNSQMIVNCVKQIESMKQNGVLKKAGLNRREKHIADVHISDCGVTKLNGTYHWDAHSKHYVHSTSASCTLAPNSDPELSHLFGSKTLTSLSSSHTTTKPIDWVLSCQHVVFYYGASVGGEERSVSKDLEPVTSHWQCVAGIEPLPKITTHSNKKNDEKVQFENVTDSNSVWRSEDVRSDLHAWMHSDDANIAKDLRNVITQIDKIRVWLNKHVQFGCQDTQVQVSCYPGDGSRYRAHLDEVYVDDSTIQSIRNSEQISAKKTRRITALLYLNERWNTTECGGAVRIYLSDGVYRDIEPVAGRLLLFNSQWLPHEVMPVFHRDRFAITLWMY